MRPSHAPWLPRTTGSVPRIAVNTEAMMSAALTRWEPVSDGSPTAFRRRPCSASKTRHETDERGFAIAMSDYIPVEHTRHHCHRGIRRSPAPKIALHVPKVQVVTRHGSDRAGFNQISLAQRQGSSAPPHREWAHHAFWPQKAHSPPNETAQPSPPAAPSLA